MSHWTVFDWSAWTPGNWLALVALLMGLGIFAYDVVPFIWTRILRYVRQRRVQKVVRQFKAREAR